MNLKYTITDEADNSQVILDPGGWESAGIGFSRLLGDKKFWSLDETFTSSLFFYGQSREFARNAEKTFGPDGILYILIEIDPNDDEQYEFFRDGQIPISMFQESLGNDGHLIKFGISQSDFWTRFINRYNSPVDIRSTTDLDGNIVTPTPKFTLPLPSQKIPKGYKANQKHNQVLRVEVPSGHPPPELIVLLGFDNETLQEIAIESNITSQVAASVDIPFFNFDSAGELIIKNLIFSFSKENVHTDANYPGSFTYFTQATSDKLASTIGSLKLYIQINSQTPIPFSETDRNVVSTFLDNDGNLIINQTNVVTDYTLSNFSQRLNKNDNLKIYGAIQQDGTDASKLKIFYLWGNSGWAHESIDESIYFSQGSKSLDAAFGTSFFGDPKNRISGNEFWQLFWDASINLFPSLESNGSPIKAGDTWLISGSGNLGGTIVDDTYVITALVNTPGQTPSNWRVSQKHIWEGLENYGIGEADIVFNSSFPDSTTEAFLTHDVAAGIIDRITGQSGLFYSEYLGNPFTSRVYPEVGCGSQKANMKGLHLRGYPLEGDPDANKNKPFFSSFQDWFEGIYPIEFLGLGYEKKSGVDIIRCEPISYFFQDGDPVVKLSNVFFIKRTYDADHQFNSVKMGYAKWQSQAATGVGTPSGIDDPQAVQTRNSRFKKIGKGIEFLSKWVAASLTLETTRRIGNLLSANYTYDNDTFVISLKNDAGDFTPELNENFSSITNLTNSDTRYNSDLTPARNFLRGLNYLSGCLQNYLTSVWKFVSGEGNYVMTSTMTTDCPGDDSGEVMAENGDIPVSNTPLFVPMLYEIVHELTWDQYKLLRDNKNLPIGISQTDTDHKKFYIKSCERIVGTGDFKIVAWPKTLDDAFDIEVTESATQYASSRRHEARFAPEYD